MRFLGDVFLFASLAGFVVFLAGFGFTVNWRATVMGKHIMVFMLALGLVTAFAAVRAIGILDGKEDLVRVIVWALVCLVVWWRVILFAKIRADGRKAKSGK